MCAIHREKTLKVFSVQRYAKWLGSFQEKQYNAKREKDFKRDFRMLHDSMSIFLDSVKLRES